MLQSSTRTSAGSQVGAASASASASRTALKIVGFALLMAIAAQVRIPVPGTPVPMTLHLLAFLLTGFFLSPAAAASSMALYVAMGTAGLPVFALGSAGLFGATGGYLAAFVVGAPVVSWLRGKCRAPALRLWAAGLVGTAIVFALGVAWMTPAVGLQAAMIAGVSPFLLKALIELLLAGAIAMNVNWLVRFRLRSADA